MATDGSITAATALLAVQAIVTVVALSPTISLISKTEIFRSGAGIVFDAVATGVVDSEFEEV